MHAANGSSRPAGARNVPSIPTIRNAPRRNDGGTTVSPDESRSRRSSIHRQNESRHIRCRHLEAGKCASIITEVSDRGRRRSRTYLALVPNETQHGIRVLSGDVTQHGEALKTAG